MEQLAPWFPAEHEDRLLSEYQEKHWPEDWSVSVN